MTSRQLQRIEQGMGRGIRSWDDYCLVLLVGGRLMRRLHDPEALSHLSAASAAQLRLSRLVAEQLAEGGAEDCQRQAGRVPRPPIARNGLG
jgi:Rad3-related DNA helicase